MLLFICVGFLLFLISISLLFEDFTTGLLGVVISVGLIAIGLHLLKKRKPYFFQILKEKNYSAAFKSLFATALGTSSFTQYSSGDLFVDTFHLAGVSYYDSNIKKLANLNPQWNLTTAQLLANGKADRKVYRYNFTNAPVQLVPEPKNPHDKNAVAVHIAGQLVGYISREQSVYVQQLLNSGRIKYISGFIGGGDYKYITPDGKAIPDSIPYSVNIRIGHT